VPLIGLVAKIMQNAISISLKKIKKLIIFFIKLFNTVFSFSSKTPIANFFFRLVAIFVMLIILVAKFYPFEKETGTMCISDTEKKSDKLVFIPDKNCWGYRFKARENILYSEFGGQHNKRMNVIFGQHFPSWLSNKEISLDYHDLASTHLADNYMRLKEDHQAGHLGTHLIEDKELGLSFYERVYSENSVHRDLFSEDTNPAFHADCVFFRTVSNQKKRYCALSFPFKETNAHMGPLNYTELKDIKHKVIEMKQLLDDLIEEPQHINN